MEGGSLVSTGSQQEKTQRCGNRGTGGAENGLGSKAPSWGVSNS